MNSLVIIYTRGLKVFFSTWIIESVEGIAEIPGLLEGSNLLKRLDTIDSVVGRKEKLLELIRLDLFKSLKVLLINMLKSLSLAREFELRDAKNRLNILLNSFSFVVSCPLNKSELGSKLFAYDLSDLIFMDKDCIKIGAILSTTSINFDLSFVNQS